MMDFSYSDRARQMMSALDVFMRRDILPANAEWHRGAAAGVFPLELVERLKRRAQSEGLWNLFLPSLDDDEPGTRLSNLDYAPLAEIMGRAPWSAEVFNCSAPDSGNMELLKLFATPAQRAQWLTPLLYGEIRSCVAISEPDVASSDPTNLQTTIRRDGDDYVVNGRKWFITGAQHPRCAFVIVMGLSDASPEASPHARHSMLIVPMDAPGLRVVRNIPVMGHKAVDGHCELVFRDVRVSKDNLIGEEGKGFALAQARLGPGRIHHCMRAIGQCELALELMCERAQERKTFGKMIGDNSNIQDWIAHSRLEIDQARLLVLRAAWKIDAEGAKAAHLDVSAIKIVAAQLQTRVLDRAMQVFGAMGLTPDTPLAALWSWGRAMRFLDGPDEVHLRSVARAELKKAKAARGDNIAFFVPPDL
jgi:acyl-CoA dehydrogenase